MCVSHFVVFMAGTVTEQWCSVSCPCHFQSWSSTQRWDLLRKSAFFSVDYPLICLWSSTHEVMSQTLGSESSVDLFVLQFGRWVFTVCLTHFNCKCLDFSVAEQLVIQSASSAEVPRTWASGRLCFRSSSIWQCFGVLLFPVVTVCHESWGIMKS